MNYIWTKDFAVWLGFLALLDLWCALLLRHFYRVQSGRGLTLRQMLRRKKEPVYQGAPYPLILDAERLGGTWKVMGGDPLDLDEGMGVTTIFVTFWAGWATVATLVWLVFQFAGLSPPAG